MIRAVLDTNVFVSGIGWLGEPARVVDSAFVGRIALVTSPALLAELSRVLTYPRLAAVIGDPDDLIQAIAAVAEVVLPTERITTLADEPDNRVLEAAVTGRVHFIVTGDHAMRSLEHFRGIEILSPVELLARLKTRRRRRRLMDPTCGAASRIA